MVWVVCSIVRFPKPKSPCVEYAVNLCLSLATANKECPQFSYFPFGGGARVCIGEHFAKMEGILVLASIAQRYRLSLIPGQTIVPEPKMTLRPRRGIRMRVFRRSQE